MGVDWKMSLENYERELAECDPATDPSKVLMLRRTIELTAWMLLKTEEKRREMEKQRKEEERKLLAADRLEVEGLLAQLRRVREQEFVSRPRVCDRPSFLFF